MSDVQMKAAEALSNMAKREKVYHHRTPGAKFYVSPEPGKIKELSFVGGTIRLSSIDPAYRSLVERELDAVANIPSSHIFTTQEVLAPEEKLVVGEIMQAATGSFDDDKNIKGNPVTVPIPVQKSGPPTLAQAGLQKSFEAAQAAIDKK
jgi:hypothetical protein